jgi:hypothetical protein
MMLLRRGVPLAAPLLALLVAGGLAGCDPLEVDDPLAVLDEDLNDAEGAQLLRRQALGALYSAVARSAWQSGLLSDEFLYQQAEFWELAGVVSPDEFLDRRAVAEHVQQWGGENGSIQNGAYPDWQGLWLRHTPVALDKLRAYAPPAAREAYIAEMYAVRGFAAVHLAEHFCPGFPLHQVTNYKLTYGPPLSTDDAFEQAVAAFDSAASGAADNLRVLNLARVGRARALLNLARFAEAASTAADVPTDYVYQAEYSGTFDVFQPNELGMGPDFLWGEERSVADREGGTGLDFVSAGDPRLQVVAVGVARDGVTTLYGIAKYPDTGSPITLASGVEARLIEAEAALQASDLGTWLSKLNQLRLTAGLADTTDPGTAAARVDLTFRERAFWLFGTGHRLGDLRRIIRQYGRTSESAFPTGTYWRGGSYGSGTSFPFDRSEVTFSPGVTGCTGE